MSNSSSLDLKNCSHKSFAPQKISLTHQIAECHGGTLNDSRFGDRMRGEGKIAESIKQLFAVSYKKHFKGRKSKPLDLTLFRRPPKHGQMEMF